MTKERKKLVTLWVVALACALSSIGLLVSPTRLGPGVFAGGAIAVANWAAIRWAMGRIENTTSGSAWAVVLGFKFVGALVASGVMLGVLHVHPLGFMLGLSPFVLGLVIGTTWPLKEDSKSPATEPREVTGVR